MEDIITGGNDIFDRISVVTKDLSLYFIFALGFILCRYFFQYLRRTIFATKSAIPRDLGRNVNKIIRNSKPLDKLTPLQKFNLEIKENSSNPKMEPFEVLNRMEKMGISPNITTYNTLLDASFTCKNFEQAYQLFNEMKDIVSPIPPDVITFNIFFKGIKLIFDSGEDIDLSIIQATLTEMSHRDILPNEITYNTIIDLLVSMNQIEKAWNYFEEMKYQNLTPDLFTYSTLIKGAKNFDTNSSNLNRIFEIIRNAAYLQMANLPIQSTNPKIQPHRNKKAEDDKTVHFDEILFNSLVEACLKFDDFGKIEEILDLMEFLNLPPSHMTYGILMKAYGQHKRLDRSIELFHQMKEKGVKANEVTYGCILDACIRNKDFASFHHIKHQLLEDKNVGLNVVLATTLVKGLGACGEFNEALQIYEQTNDEYAHKKFWPNIIFYNSMLDCCVRCQQYEKLYEIFESILEKSEKSKAQDRQYLGEPKKTKTGNTKKGDDLFSISEEEILEPDLITYSTLIKGLCRSKQMDKVINIYEQMKQKNMVLDEVLFNSLLDGFTKSHNVKKGLEIYQDMRNLGIKRSNVTYSILIKLYASASEVEKALNLFYQMKQEGIKPGLVVYTCLMQTCIRNKLIQKALDFYEDMKKNFVNPDHVTYNTIVNGCVFNGKLNKACEFLVEACNQNIKLAEDIYNNVLKNLLTNLKMSFSNKQYYGSSILAFVKSHGIRVNKEYFSRVNSLINCKREDQRPFYQQSNETYFDNAYQNTPQNYQTIQPYNSYYGNTSNNYQIYPNHNSQYSKQQYYQNSINYNELGNYSNQNFYKGQQIKNPYYSYNPNQAPSAHINQNQYTRQTTIQSESQESLNKYPGFPSYFYPPQPVSKTVKNTNGGDLSQAQIQTMRENTFIRMQTTPFHQTEKKPLNPCSLPFNDNSFYNRGNTFSSNSQTEKKQFNTGWVKGAMNPNSAAFTPSRRQAPKVETPVSINEGMNEFHNN